MSHFILPVSGFFLLAVSDFIQTKSKTAVSRLLSYAGYGIIVAAVLRIAFFSGITESSSQVITGWLLTMAFGTLLIYSVFFEIPLLKLKNYSSESSTVMRGTYGYCRHPGFWWLFFLLASLALIHVNIQAMLISAGIVFLNFCLVFIEDRFFFPIIFPEYGEYKQKVPFLIPILGRRRHKGEQKNTEYNGSGYGN